jgi:predicted permease
LLFRNDMLHGEKPLSKEADAPRVDLLPAQTGLVGARESYSTPLYILMIAVGIILLIASANVSGLLLARSAARQKEIALRLALGGGRWRIVRQLLTESVLLSVFGGALAIGIAYWGAQAIVKFVAAGSTRPLGFEPTLDLRVLLFTAGISLLAGIIFGLAPAARGMRVDLTPALKQGTGSSDGGGRVRNRWFNVGNSLVVAQVALTIVVLVGAGLIVRTLQNLRNIDPGFDISNIVNVGVDPTLAGYKGAQVDIAIGDLQKRLSAIPSVTSVSYSSDALLSDNLSNTTLHVVGSSDKVGVESDIMQVGLDFFATMKMPLRDGRDFSPADFAAVSTYAAVVAASSASNSVAARVSTPVGPPVPAIVNEEFVHEYLPKTNALGQRLEYPDSPGQRSSGTKAPGFIVVGVVGNARYNSLRREVKPTAYVPFAGSSVNFELRTAMNPLSIIAAVRRTVNQWDSNSPIFYIRTESEIIDQLLFQERLIARLSSLFGALALVLACVGLYGLLSYEVSRRTREIGIRMALGAAQRNVLRIVVGQGIGLAITGVMFGFAAAFCVTRYLGSVLYDVHPGDPITLIAVAAILLFVALLACFVPARRATRVDPMVALRNE